MVVVTGKSTQLPLCTFMFPDMSKRVYYYMIRHHLLVIFYEVKRLSSLQCRYIITPIAWAIK